MNKIENEVRTTWLNDHLDLYNFATKIGDSIWQQDILRKLHNKEKEIQEEIKILVTKNLWITFDDVNSQLLDLYKKMRENNSLRQNSKVLDQLFSLKHRRVELLSKISLQKQLL
jgi:hypothetical protein